MSAGLERVIERGLFASRWLLAPFYIGLMIALGVVLIVFTEKLFDYVMSAMHLDLGDAILGVLGLIDLALIGGLVVIVVFSSYENFVSKIDVGDHADLPDWKGKVDFSGLKLKLIASIVAISGIHLLKIFMDIHKYDEKEIFWMVTIHLVFVVSGVLLALMDYIASIATKKK